MSVTVVGLDFSPTLYYYLLGRAHVIVVHCELVVLTEPPTILGIFPDCFFGLSSAKFSNILTYKCVLLIFVALVTCLMARVKMSI